MSCMVIGIFVMIMRKKLRRKWNFGFEFVVGGLGWGLLLDLDWLLELFMRCYLDGMMVERFVDYFFICYYIRYV